MTSKERKLWAQAVRILRQNSVTVQAPPLLEPALGIEEERHTQTEVYSEHSTVEASRGRDDILPV